MSGVVEIDLTSGDLRPPAVEPGGTTYVLIRWRDRPVGRLILEGGSPRNAEDWRRALLDAAAPGLAAAEEESRSADSAGPPGGFPAAGAVSPGDVCVIVPTRDRPVELAACLGELMRLAPPPGELVVVDSASTRPEEVARVAGGRGRLIRLDRPGLSHARNTGAAAASRPILAFLDDDCRVDSGWLRAVCAGFGDPCVEAVTGQLLPSEVRTAAQRLFMTYFHMDRRGFVPRRFARGDPPSRHWPLDSWRMGSGGNLAVRAETLRRLGGFRESLGLGTPAQGGEDLFLLWSIIEAGGMVVYRPDAFAWHRHHGEPRDLKRIMYGYGAGHAAYLRAARAAGAPAGRVALYRVSFWLDRVRRLGRSAAGLSPMPAPLVLREMAGSLAGGRLGRRAERLAPRNAPPAARPGRDER